MTLQMPQNPPVFGYGLSNAFGTLNFVNLIALATPPGETNRLFMLERAGRVAVITNLAAPNRTVFMDITARVSRGCEEGLLGLAFHPNYASNVFFFLFYFPRAPPRREGPACINGWRDSRFRPRTRTWGIPTPSCRSSPNSIRPVTTLKGIFISGRMATFTFPSAMRGIRTTPASTASRSIAIFFGILRIDVDRHPANFPPTAHAALMNAKN